MTMITGADNPNGWSVLSTQPANGQDEMGRYVPGHQVNARLNSGATFSVFVPNTDVDNLAKVQTIIANKAAAIAAIVNLAG